MSIWTDLLLLHGHAATPTALALLTQAGACVAAGTAAPATPTEAPAPRAAATAGEPHRHPLRTVGQLR